MVARTVSSRNGEVAGALSDWLDSRPTRDARAMFHIAIVS